MEIYPMRATSQRTAKQFDANIGSLLSKWGPLACGLLLLGVACLYELLVSRRPTALAEKLSSEHVLNPISGRGVSAGWYERAIYKYTVADSSYQTTVTSDNHYRTKREAMQHLSPPRLTVAYSSSNPSDAVMLKQGQRSLIRGFHLGW